MCNIWRKLLIPAAFMVTFGLFLGPNPAHAAPRVPVVFAELETWLPDSDSWLGKQINVIIAGIRSATSSVVSGITKFIQKVIIQFETALQAVLDFFQNSYEYIRDWLVWVKDRFLDTFEWFKDSFSEALKFITEIYGKLIGFLDDLWTKFWDFVWFIGDWLFDFLFRVIDWLVDMAMSSIDFLFDQIPEIEIPGEFETAVQTFVKYGMIMNRVAPVKECFFMFSIYVTVYTIVMIYRIVKSFIPVIAT